MGQQKKSRGSDNQFILLWIVAHKPNAIQWEWLYSGGVLRSLRESQIANLDTVFVMWREGTRA